MKLDARVRLDEMNRPDAPGAAASAAMNFVEADRTPELELNEILWRSVHGANAACRRRCTRRSSGPWPAPTGDDDADDWWDRLRAKKK